MTVKIATDLDSEGPAGPLSVATELEAIFSRLPRPASSPAPDPVPRRELPPRRPRLWIGIALLIALALMITIASAALLVRTARAPRLQARPQAAQPVPIGPQPAPIAPAPSQPRPAAGPPAPIPSPTANAQPAAQTPPASASRPQHARAVREHRPVARATRASGSRCRAGATSAWCLHGAVIAADDRLRGAYAAAIRAGVDRGTLEGVRSDWSRLRRRANKNPEALIRGYGLLTQQLRTEAQRAGRR